MIARDEEEALGACLESVRAHVDEIVVVDTMSTDRTLEIAWRFGAKTLAVTRESHPLLFYLDDEANGREVGAPPPYSNEWGLADFGGARNESFKLATSDFVLWLDADDVLERANELREVVADMVARGLDMAFLPYDYARDHLGRVFYRQWRERIVRRGATTWVQPVHEVMLPVGRLPPSARYDWPSVSHRRKADRKTIPNRNYKILLRQLKRGQAENGVVLDGQIDPRTLFYLGQEARFIEPARAAEFYERYLRLSGWAEERAAAHVSIGQLAEFGQLGLPPEEALARADRDYATAAAEMPGNPDGLFGMARIAYLRKRWADCVAYSERAFALGNPESMLGCNPFDRLYRPHVYFNHALSNLGRVDEAIASCRAALAACPDDPGVPGGASGMLTHNLAIYVAGKERAMQAQPSEQGRPSIEFDKNEDVDAPPALGIPRDAMVIWAMQLWKQVVAEGRIADARMLLNALPSELHSDAVIAKMRASTERRALGGPPLLNVEMPSEIARPRFESAQPKHGKRSVVFWVGPAIEPWTPLSPNTTGVGGSETACIEVAKHLALTGNSVKVYGCCPDGEGVYDGVRYVHWERFRSEPIDCDVLVCSRAPSIMEAHDRISARLKLLWVHDVHCGPPTPQMERWLLRFDRVLCLSKWHREFFASTYPTLHSDRVLVTRNGIDPERFTPDAVGASSESGVWAAKRNRLIFSSSPNRGLDTLLVNLPFVRREVSDAELHVYYGFDVWEAFAKTRNDPAELGEIARYRAMLDAAVRQGGVHWHGRVNQRELAEAFLRSKVWSYPTGFSETSCCHPDTLVSVPGDHRGGTPRIRIADLVGKSGFPVYAYDASEHRFRMATCNRVWETKIADEMVAVELDDGQVLKLTPDHRVMNFDGEWEQAGDLRPGGRLMALHHRYDVMIKDADGHWASESRLVGEWLAGRPLSRNEHVDHADPFRLDNRPERLTVMSASEHFSKTHRGSVRSHRADAARTAGWRAWAGEHAEELKARLARNGKKLWDRVRSLSPEEQQAWNAERAKKRVEAMRQRELSDPEFAAKILAQRQENGRRGSAVRWGKDGGRRNHRVISVRRIPGGPVYDMEVGGLHNFIANGVVVHNCVSAMEAMAAGCVPVTTRLAALGETVRHGVLIDPGPNYGMTWVNEVVRVLKDDAYRLSLAEPARAYALSSLSWSSLAAEWEEMFDRLIAEVEENPVPLYRRVA